MQKYFEYGEAEKETLKAKDRKLAQYIDLLGHPDRPVQDDLFSSVVNSIIGQQISTKAHVTVWNRFVEIVGTVNADSILARSDEELQACGITFKKVSYIKSFSRKVSSGEFPIDAIRKMSDKQAIVALSSLDGIGVWTAEMMLLHCLQRPDILSSGDLAIVRGMRMVYRHRKIDRKLFEKYRRRLSPFGSVASIYFWKISAGAVEGLTDPAERGRRK